MAVTQEVVESQLTDTAIGPMLVTTSSVVGFDVDDLVTTTVQSIATALQMFNIASAVNSKYTQNRRKVSINGVTVGGY